MCSSDIPYNISESAKLVGGGGVKWVRQQKLGTIIDSLFAAAVALTSRPDHSHGQQEQPVMTYR